MKKIPYLFIVASASAWALFGCLTIQEIGRMGEFTPRNTDTSAKYVLLKNYMGGTRDELKDSRAKTIEQAAINVVRSTPGGEFLRNVKIYVVKGRYVAVEGDVWGVAKNQNYRGFRVGDRVQWNMGLKNPPTGSVHELLNDEECTVRDDKDGRLKNIAYDELQKLEPTLR